MLSTVHDIDVCCHLDIIIKKKVEKQYIIIHERLYIIQLHEMHFD